MTLLAYNGFEGYDDPYDQRDVSDFISSFTRNNMVYSTGRNTGGKALKYNNDSFAPCYMQCTFDAIDNSRVAIFGCALKIAEFPVAPIEMLRFGSLTNNQGFELVLGLSGNLNFRAEAISLMDSADYLINKNEWYYIEAKVKIHDSAGICIARVNEQEVLNYSGDLFFSITTTVDQLFFVFPYNSYMEIDDVYIADDQGSVNNNFLGDIRIDAIHPNGAGNHTDLTPSAGANYECIDETTMDDSDYVEGINAGDKDSYSYAAVPTDLDDSGIIGLQIKNNCKRTAAAANIKIDPFIRTGSTDYSQTAQDLPDAIGIVSGDITLDDPSDSNPWTQAKINACEFGMEVG